MAVHLTASLQQTIFGQMEQSFPNEGGGFLVGKHEGENIVIQDVIAVANTFETGEQYHRYAMTPQNWAAMEDQADALGLSLVGYYHSHPNAPAIPSEYDRVHALPNFVYVITSVMNGQAVDQKVWHLKQDRSAFENGTLVVQP
jgi:proteasome lid subunit RPN8/RPN11